MGTTPFTCTSMLEPLTISQAATTSVNTTAVRVHLSMQMELTLLLICSTTFLQLYT